MSGQIRYATYPPKCDAMKAANENVWAQFNRDTPQGPKVPRGQKIPMDHYAARELWMNTYISLGGHFSTEERDKAAPGSLANYCRKKPPPVVPPTKATGNLTVTVVDHPKGERIVGAKVEILGPESRSGKTWTDGKVTFCRLKPGRYAIAVSARRYSSESASAGVRPNSSEQKTVALKVLFGKLTVYVKDEKGNKVSGALVRLRLPDGILQERPTDAEEGKATYKNLKTGEYQVYAWKKGYTEGRETATVITRTDCDVTIRVAREIPGNMVVTVWDSPGKKRKPVPGVLVEAKERRGVSGKVFVQRREKPTDSDGSVTFESLRHGTYIVSGERGALKTDTKEGVIKKPGMSCRLDLTILHRKMFQICVTKGRWEGRSIGPVGTLKVFFEFEIGDFERRIKRKYSMKTTVTGVSFGASASLGQTVQRGPRRIFYASRIHDAKEFTANDFAGDVMFGLIGASVTAAGAGFISLEFFEGGGKVNGLAIGKSSAEVPGMFKSDVTPTSLKATSNSEPFSPPLSP